MKNLLIAGLLLTGSIALAQNQTPAQQQTPSMTTNQQTGALGRPTKKTSLRERMNAERQQDTTRKNRQPKLRPDSLRRGGATKLDTIR